MGSSASITMPNSVCRHYLGAEGRHCLSALGARLYLPGPRCPEHTPAALQGKPEPDKEPEPVSWIHSPMIAFDLETTGVDVESDRIVTAAVVSINGADKYASRWLVNPGIEIPERATAIHGITNRQAQAEGVAPDQAIAEIVNILATGLEAETPIVTMNGVFDLTILDRECRRYGIATLDDQLDRVAPIIDVRVLDKRVDPYRKGGRRLADLCETYGVKHDGAHDSCEDALAAARVAYKIAGRYSEIGRFTPAELHKRQVDWYAEQRADFAAYRRKKGEPLDDENPAWPIRPLGVPA